MIGNIVFFGFFSLLAWLVYSFILPKVEKKQDYKKLLYFFMASWFFLFVNGLFSYLGMRGLSTAGSSEPTKELKAIDQIQDGEGVVLFGKVSGKNQALTENYAAYLDEIGLWSPDRLWIELNDGEIAIDNDTYQPTNWPDDILGRSFLEIDSPVTVVGYVRINRIDQSRLIEAEVIHAGQYASFVSRSKTKLGIAAAMTIVNVIAVILLLVPIIKSIRGMRATD